MSWDRGRFVQTLLGRGRREGMESDAMPGTGTGDDRWSTDSAVMEGMMVRLAGILGAQQRGS